MKYLLWMNGKGEGPYEKSQIVEMLLSGKITGQTECLPERGSGDWVPVRSISGLLNGGGPRSRRRNTSLWIGSGILVLVSFLWLLNMGETVPKDTPTRTVLGDVTNNTLVEFEVTSECDAFIPAFTQEAQFLDSWGKVIAECFFQVRDIKPHGRSVGTARVMNLPREKLNGWRLDPEFPAPRWAPKWISWHTINVQLVEGSNTMASVTAEVW